MELMLVFLGGVVVGTILTLAIRDRFKASGTLRIDHSNPEKDTYLFEINDIDELSKKKMILLKISQE